MENFIWIFNFSCIHEINYNAQIRIPLSSKRKEKHFNYNSIIWSWSENKITTGCFTKCYPNPAKVFPFPAIFIAYNIKEAFFLRKKK